LSFPRADVRRPGEIVSSELSTERELQPEDRGSRSVSEDAAPGLGGEQAIGGSGGRKGSGDPLVSITLSRNQVDHVVRAVLGDGAAPSVSTLVSGTGFHHTQARHALSSRYRALQDNRRLSRSLLAGLLVLSCFPPEGVDLGIKDISEQLDLNTSTVHRYVLTLVAGLLERDPTRRYRLLPE
jgi:hypothetical protein